MKRRFLPILLILALCLGLLPVTALAEGAAPQTLYVGSTTIGTGYWTSSDGGKVWTSQADEPEGNNYIYYDGQGTLELHNVTIQGESNTVSAPYGSGIYALSNSEQPVSLTIKLIGENTITGTYGIFLNAEINASSYGTNATLTITGENNGSLEVSGSAHGIFVKSGTGNASLTIENASVDAKTTQTYSGYAGVFVQSGSTATNSPNISLSVDGGSLTASGTESSDGILFYVGSLQATGATTSLTVSQNAIVDARNGGISASRISVTLPTPTPTGNNSSGIIFDGSAGTVYGIVELQDDLKISEGETLSIPEGASLNTNGKLTIDGGTLTKRGTLTGHVTYKVTNVTLNKNSLTLEVGDSETLTATVEPDDATNKNVTWQSDSADVATVQNGTVTAVGEGETTIRVTTEDGDKTDTCTVVVTHGKLVHTPKQDATCYKPGTREYWTCESCGRQYSDASATIEVDPSDLIIPQLSCPTQPTATYDDGGPFTTDQYGNVYDRWGNEIWHNPSPQSASNTTIGYQLVATIDK